MGRLHSLIFLAAFSAALAGCGGGAKPPPPPVPPGGTVPPVGQLGANLESPSPGVPMSQGNGQAALQVLSQHLRGYGATTVRTQVALDYVLQTQYGYQPYSQGQNAPSTWTHLGQPMQEPILTPTYQLTANSGGNAISLQLYSRYEGNREFSFESQVNLDGLVLYSTDQVALFQGTAPSGGMALIKVAYRNPNPQMQEYFIQEVGSNNGGGYGRRFRVIQRLMETQFAYPTQPVGGQPNYPQPNNNPYF